MVSVIIPTKEREALLEATLNSVHSQSIDDWECIVVDDHSMDATLQLLDKFRTRDVRFVPASLNKQSSGASAARNHGLRVSKGDFIIFLDSDDTLAPHCLEGRLVEMSRQPNLDFAVWPTLLFDFTSGDCSYLWNIHTDENDLDRYLSMDIPWQTAGVLWRRSSLEKVGPWNENLPSWQDWDFYLRALTLNLNYQKYPTPDTYWRRPRPDSLWNHSKKDAHLVAQTLLLGEILGHFSEKGCLNVKRKRLFAGLYFQIARSWYSGERNRTRALKTWYLAYRKKLISFGHFMDGCRWFSHLTRGCSHNNLALVFPKWPEEYFISSSRTFQKIQQRANADS